MPRYRNHRQVCLLGIGSFSWTLSNWLSLAHWHGQSTSCWHVFVPSWSCLRFEWKEPGSCGRCFSLALYLCICSWYLTLSNFARQRTSYYAVFAAAVRSTVVLKLVVVLLTTLSQDLGSVSWSHWPLKSCLQAVLSAANRSSVVKRGLSPDLFGRFPLHI